MAYEVSVIPGSGFNPGKNTLPYHPKTQERNARGTAMVLLNPEDNSAGVGGAVTQVTIASGVPAKLPMAPLRYRRAISIRNFNPSTGTLYVGFTSGVTSANGFPLEAGESLPMEINGAIEMWGAANASIDVRIIELA